MTSTQRILEAAPLVPPTGALSGWAAAYVLGVGVLDGLDPFTMEALPVTVSLGGQSGRRNPPGVVYARDRLPSSNRLVRHGITVTTPARTAFDGARWRRAWSRRSSSWTRWLRWSTSISARSRPGRRPAAGGGVGPGTGRPVLGRRSQRQPMGEPAADVLPAGGRLTAAGGERADLRPERARPGHRRPVRRRGGSGHRVRRPGPSATAAAPADNPAEESLEVST